MNVTLTPDDAYRKAYAHYVQKRYESAREICRGVLQADPGHMHAAYLLAVVEHRLGSPEAGDEILQQAVAHIPNNVRLSYRPLLSPRYTDTAQPALDALLSGGLDSYIGVIESFGRWLPSLQKIPAATDHPAVPHWNNIWIPPFDGIALYCRIAAQRPAVYLEVGSGNSTRFVRRAIADHGLATKIGRAHV